MDRYDFLKLNKSKGDQLGYNICSARTLWTAGERWWPWWFCFLTKNYHDL